MNLSLKTTTTKYQRTLVRWVIVTVVTTPRLVLLVTSSKIYKTRNNILILFVYTNVSMFV